MDNAQMCSSLPSLGLLHCYWEYIYSYYYSLGCLVFATLQYYHLSVLFCKSLYCYAIMVKFESHVLSFIKLACPALDQSEKVFETSEMTSQKHHLGKVFFFFFSLWFKSDHLDCNTLTHNREQKIFPIEVSLRTYTKPRGGQGVIIRGYPLFWIFVKKQWNYQRSFNWGNDPQFFFLIWHPPLILTCIDVCLKGAWVGIALCYVNDSPSKDN